MGLEEHCGGATATERLTDFCWNNSLWGRTSLVFFRIERSVLFEMDTAPWNMEVRKYIFAQCTCMHVKFVSREQQPLTVSQLEDTDFRCPARLISSFYQLYANRTLFGEILWILNIVNVGVAHFMRVCRGV